MVITGVIRPPPEIRAVADRTALYVAKNGRAFESRILNSAKGRMPKFAFLQTSNPFHAYYEDKIQFYEANGGVDPEDDKEKDKQTKSDAKSEKKKASKEEGDETKSGELNRVAVKKKAAVSAAIDPVAKALLTQRNKIAQIRSASAAAAHKKSTSTSSEEKEQEDEDVNGEGVAEMDTAEEAVVVVQTLEPPPALHFINIVAPATLSVAQIETIQLVAQLTALDHGKGGCSFLQQLTFREWNNPTYAFCHPRSGHFAYFSALVDAYRRVLTLWTTSTPSSSTTSSTASILAVNNNNNSQMVKDKDDKVNEMANNVQKCLEIAAYRAEYKRDLIQQRKQQQQDADNDATPSVAALVDWHDFVIVETIDFPVDQQVVTLPPPPPPPLQETAAAQVGGGDNGMNDSDDDDDDADATEEQIRVVPKYTPKVVSAAAAAAQRAEQMTMIDPITGKSVAIKDMPEHLRIQLLDPKWAQERKKFQDKQKETNLVGADTFADNVAKFAQARGMVTRTDQQDLLMNETDASRKRLQDANHILRQQALHPSTSVGPSLPTRGGGAHHAAPAMDLSMQPDLKRPRLGDAAAAAALQLPPPRHMSSALPPPPPPPPPPAAAGSEAATTATTAYPTTYVFAPPGFEAGLPPPPPPGGVDPFAAATETTTTTDAVDTDAAPGGGEVELLSEADFVASLPNDPPLVTLQIRIPNDQAQMAWNFYGQIVALSSIHVMSTVKKVKQQLSRTHLNGMPANKIQLKMPSNNTFLKDSLTLAALNIGAPTSVTTLELVPKTRGGRK